MVDRTIGVPGLMCDVALLLAFAVMLAWYPCCGETLPGYAACTYCLGSGNNAPQYVTVVLSGAADDDCTDCESYDGTYVVEHDEQCEWQTAYSETECGFTNKNIWIIAYGDGGGATPYYLWGRFGQEGVSPNLYYFYGTQQAGKFDCLSPDEEYTLSYNSEDIGGFGGGNNECDLSGATLVVSFGDNS